MTQKQPSDFEAREWNWSPHVDGSYGLLSAIVENTDYQKNNSEIYRQTENSINEFQKYIDQSNPKIGKIVTAEDFHRLFLGNISEQVLAESFGLNNIDGRPIGPSIELLIAKRLAKVQKGLANLEKEPLQKTTKPSFSRKETVGIPRGQARFRGINAVSSETQRGLYADQDFVEGAPSAFYNVVHPYDPDKRIIRIHWGVAFGNLLGRIASNVPVIGHILNLYTSAYAHDQMGQIQEGLKNQETQLAAANDTPLMEKIWNKVTFNTENDDDNIYDCKIIVLNPAFNIVVLAE
ncbi:MAG: hypothetical protein EBY16_02925 [Gammaproteobacteria bacterium]|nr:hypothetical protein [Gammaproteobacteria bacterium]